MKVTIKILFIILLSLYAQAIEIDENSSGIDILSKSSIVIDEKNTLTQGILLEKSFQQNTQETLNLGIAPNTTLWIKFTLKNRTNKELHKILEFDNPETEDIDFYYDKQMVKEGMFHHSSTRETINPILRVTLAPYEEKTIYVKAHCKISTLIAKLTLWNDMDFLHKEYEHKIYIFIFFAIIITLLIYNFTLLVFTRDIVYLYYILYLSAVIFFESVYLGFAQLYFFSNEITIFTTKGTIGYISMLVLPMILFTMEFLNTKQFPRIHQSLKIYLYTLPLFVVLSFDNFFFDLNIMLIFFPLAFLMIFTGFYALYHGVKQAKLYIVGWSFLILSLIFSVLKSLGGYDIFVHFIYINELAFALESLIFSIALAQRINILSEEKMESDKKTYRVSKRGARTPRVSSTS